MAGVKDYNATAGSNTTLASTSLQEGQTKHSDLNNQIRQILADVKSDLAMRFDNASTLQGITFASGTIPGTAIVNNLGIYWYDSTDTTTADNGTTVLVTTSGERYKRFAGGSGGTLSAVVDDTTPQLGGNLDVNGNTITSASAGNVTIDPDGAGLIVLGAASVTVEQYIAHSGDTSNYHEFTPSAQDFRTAGSSRLDISNSGIRLGAANARVTTILDEDDMSSDSATALATQQSIKAYADTKVPGDSVMQTSSAITATFNTPGTFAPSYNVREMRYMTIGKWCHFTIDMDFDSSTYSGASGTFRIANLPVSASTNGTDRQPIHMYHHSALTYPASCTTVHAYIVPSADHLLCVANGSGVGVQSISPTQITASTNFKFHFAGKYEID